MVSIKPRECPQFNLFIPLFPHAITTWATIWSCELGLVLIEAGPRESNEEKAGITRGGP